MILNQRRTLPNDRQRYMNTLKYTSANDPLVNPENHAVLLIDHQYLQLLTVRFHDGATVVNNVTALAKAAKLFNVPTLITTAFAERQAVVKEIQDVFPGQKPIDRTTFNSWEDQRVVDWVKSTGRKKLVFAGLWTEICLTFSVLSALGVAVARLDGRHPMKIGAWLTSNILRSQPTL